MKLLDIRQRASSARLSRFACGSLFAVLLLLLAGCEKDPGSTRDDAPAGTGVVTVYCSVDEQFARGILDRFAAESGIRVTPLFDSEAGKTTGLINRIREEARSGRVRADVFWSSELFGTMLLGRDGLLQPYQPQGVDDIPRRYKHPAGLWTAVANRARVIAFDPSRSQEEDVPRRWENIAQPAYAPRLAFANPLFGTTRGHFAAMRATWGSERFEAFLRRLRDGGASMLDGNSATVRAVTGGRAALAATDTDDVWVFQRAGNALDLVYPDMGDGGTLLIPCSAAILKGAPHFSPARQLVDFLVSAKLEEALAKSDSRNIPVRATLREELGITEPPASQIPFETIAENMDAAMKLVRDILIR